MNDWAMTEAELVERRRLRPPAGEDFWLFAYGSLMWNPGFPYCESHPALVRGYHRAFCVLSQRYRGTPERPGLVLGLDRGGACRGRAYRIAAADCDAVCDYLHEREMITGTYEPRWLPAALLPGPASPMEVPPRPRRPVPTRVKAVAYVADRAHWQYRRLPAAEIVDHILAGVGQRGSNIDYLESTVAHLDELGVADGPLHLLLRRVRAVRAASADR